MSKSIRLVYVLTHPADLHISTDEGETFSAFVCINNESPVAVEGVSLHIEMHSGPGAVSSAQAGTDAAASVNVVPLAHVTTNNSSTTSEFGGSLAPRNKLEALINYPVTEPGPHGLVCTVSYFVPQSPGTDSVYASLLQDGSGRLQRSTMIETYFRKFYRFQVAQAPLETEARVLSVQTASMLQCQANPYIRERVLLQVTLINRSSAGAPPMAIETVEPGCDENASAAPRWYWRQLDQPEVRCSWWDDDLLGLADSPGKSQNYKEVLSASSSLGGTLLLPGESRQIIFVMYPTRPMRHAPLPPHSTMDSSRKQPSSQTGDVEETYALSKQHTTFTSPVQLGFVKTLCRSYMGEPTIVRSAPVVHLPSFPQPTTVTSPHETLLQPSGMHETDHTASPPKGKSVRPDLQLQTELLVLSTPSEVTAEEPFDLEYDLWLRDVNLAQSDALARRQSGARTSANLGGDEIEDEDDRPLSEVASDVARSQDGSKAGSARSSRASSVHGTPWLESRSPSSRRTLSQLIEDQVHQLEHQRPPVWLKLAVQLTRIGPYPSPLSTTSPEPASLPAPGLERQGTVKAPSVAAPLGYLARRPLGDSTDTAHQVSHASSISSRTLSSASATIVPASHSQRSASVRDTASSFLSPAFQRGGFVQRRESSSTLSTSTATPSFSYSSLPPAQADRTAPSPSPSSVAQLHASEASRPQSSFWPSPVVIEGSAEAEDSSSPDPDVVPLGASLLPLPPIRLAPGQPATSVRFAASYLTSRSGTARIGGPRILLVDWWNETQDPNMDPAVSPDSYSPDVAVNLLDLARATIAEVEVA